MAHPLCLPDTWLNRNLEMTVFEERRKPGKPGYMKKKPLGAKERTNHKLNPLIICRKIIAVLYATYAVAKRKPEKKNSGLYGI